MFKNFKYKFIPKWLMCLDYIRKFTMLCTFFGMIIGFAFSVYYTFIKQSFYPLLMISLFMLISIRLNTALQDGR